MKQFNQFFIFLFLLISTNSVIGQEPIDRVKFFQDESPITVTLEMDQKDLLGKKESERYIPATITMAFKDGMTVTGGIQVTVRGNFRKETCYMPGLRLDFKSSSTVQLSKLGRLKMVCGCSSGSDNESLVMKEYLVYKMYNLFTEKSLKVRPMIVTYQDAAGKRKPYTQFAFLIEDIDEMAKRNGMEEVEGTVFQTEVTDRDQMTMVALFQYMIGNTDWSVPNYHNVKLVGPKGDLNARPFVVPYDFDICGFVDPPYATVDEQLGIDNVKERLYRGFPRTFEEIKAACKLFHDNKEKIYALVNTNETLSSKDKSRSLSFIDDFYKIISDDKQIQRSFVDGARTR